MSIGAVLAAFAQSAGSSILLPRPIQGISAPGKTNAGAPAAPTDKTKTTPAGPAQPVDSVELSASARAQTELTEEEQARVDELAKTDREVRAHEEAHMAAAGGYARGGPQYEFETGPDGKEYAIAGEVKIDTSPIPGDPDATIQKMRVVKAAALAPAEPSAQDRRVAADAEAKIQQARQEKAQQQQEEQSSAQPSPAGGASRSAAANPAASGSAYDQRGGILQPAASPSRPASGGYDRASLQQQQPRLDLVA